MNWDPFQREVLAELGHVIYRQAGVAMPSEVDALHLDASAFDTALIDGQMLACVARAAAMSTDALQARIGELQVIASLRGNPAGKRALWPRLRAMRRKPE